MPDKPRTQRPTLRAEKLISVGQSMATWMFNVAQYPSIPEQLREEMKQMVKTWDKVRAGGE